MFDPKYWDDLATNYETTIQLSPTELVKLIDGGIDSLGEAFEGNLDADIGNIKHSIAANVVSVLNMYREIKSISNVANLNEQAEFRMNRQFNKYLEYLYKLHHKFEKILQEISNSSSTETVLDQFFGTTKYLDFTDIIDMINDERVRFRLEEFVNKEITDKKYLLQRGILLWIFKELELNLQKIDEEKGLNEEFLIWIRQNTEELVFTALSIIENYRQNLIDNEIISVPERRMKLRLVFYDEEVLTENGPTEFSVVIKLTSDLITYSRFYDQILITITDYKKTLDSYENPSDGQKIKMLIYGALAKAITYIIESNNTDNAHKFSVLQQKDFWDRLQRRHSFDSAPLDYLISPADLNGINYRYTDFNLGNIELKIDDDENRRLIKLLRETVLSTLKNKKVVRRKIKNGKKKVK